DLNGDGVINQGDNTLDNPGDRQIIGNNAPRYQFGFTLSGRWNGVGLSAFSKVLASVITISLQKQDYFGDHTTDLTDTSLQRCGRIFGPKTIRMDIFHAIAVIPPWGQTDR